MALILAGFWAPALAAAAWTAPVDLSAAGSSSCVPQIPNVGIDAGGDAAFTWRLLFCENGSLAQARWRSAAGELGAVRTLSKPGREALNPQVAVAANGAAVFAWEHLSESEALILARACSAAGCSSRMQLSKRGHSALRPSVAVDADGDSVFAWERYDGTNWRIQARTLSAAGELSPIETLSATGQDAVGPRVAVDAAGDAVFAWRTLDEQGQARIEGRARSAAGDLSPVQTLSPAGDVEVTHDVAVDANGDAVFTWQLFGSSTRDQVVQARARSAAGDLSPVQTLSAHQRPASFPDVAVDADGDAMITWVQTNDAGYDVLRARARSAVGALSAVQRISAADEDAGRARVAVDADGDAVFAWGGRLNGPDWILARTRSVDGALGRVQTVSATGAGERAYGPPSLAVNATGDAVVAWMQGHSSGFTAQASAGP